MDTPEDGALDRTRTYDPQLRKLMLYPLSYERILDDLFYPFASSNQKRRTLHVVLAETP
jgi:hypothetical protein